MTSAPQSASSAAAAGAATHTPSSTTRRPAREASPAVVGRRSRRSTPSYREATRARRTSFWTLPVALQRQLVDDLDHPRDLVVGHLGLGSTR